MCDRRNWSEGAVLVAVETERGVVLASRDELERLVREQLAGVDVVGALLHAVAWTADVQWRGRPGVELIR